MRSDDRDFAAAYLARSAAAAADLARDDAALDLLGRMADATAASMRAGGKLMIAGNGGSAADAQHIAGEFVVRLLPSFDRAPLAAIALTVDGSVMTAGGNDYGFDQIFARQVEALGRPDDVLLGISTSGRSANVVKALAAARERGVLCLGFAGRDGGAMVELCDMIFRAPSDETLIIQQCHITAAHAFCALVERAMFRDRIPR